MDENVESAEHTTASTEETPSYCSLPQVPVREFSPDVGPDREALILVLDDKWVNGTVLHYYFFDQEDDGEEVRLSDGSREWRSWVGDAEHRDVVRRAFQLWKDVGIGLEFEEVGSRHEAEIRIGFMQGNGSWSYVGRQVLNIGTNKRTMNFGWDLTRRPEDIDTAIHEIGHTLGFPHEHQNPNAGIVWDEEAVYEALSRPPNNWSRDKTFYNIIRKINPDDVQGSSWDANSIMHYPFRAGLIQAPAEYQDGIQPEDGLSPRDKEWVKTFYPPMEPEHPELKSFNLELLSIEPGQQRNFVIRPQATRYYTIRTFGISDTVMVLFEDAGDRLRYLTADDDSGLADNAKIRAKLFQDRQYVLRVRLYYSGGSGETGVMMW